MKRGMLRCACLLAAAVLLCGCAADSGDAVKAEPHTTLSFSGAEGFTEVASEGDLRLYVDASTAQFYCENIATGQILRSNPEHPEEDTVANSLFRMNMQSQLKIGFVNSSLSYDDIYNYVGSIKAKTYTVKPITGGVRFTFDFAYEGFEVPMEVVLKDGAVQVSVPVDEIVEYKDNLITECVLLPYMGAVAADQGGEMVIPDGCGALIPVDAPADKYVGYVYGRDAAYSQSLKSTRTEQALTLPCFGLQSPAGGFLATIGEGASLCRVTAVPAGTETGYANLFATATLRNTDTAVLQEMSGSARTVQVINKSMAAIDRFEVCWQMLTPEQDYSAMAQMLRDRLGFAEKTAERNDCYLELLLAVREKGTVLAIPVEKVTPYITFDRAAEIGASLSADGVDHLLVKLNGWQSGGDYYKIPLLSKPESKLGGKSAWQSLLGTDGDVRYAAAVDYLDLYASGNGVRQKNDAVRDVSGGFYLQSVYRRSTFTKSQSVDEWYLAKSPVYSELLTEALKAKTRLFDETGGNLLPSDGHNSSVRGITPTDRETALGNYLAAYETASAPLLFTKPMGYALPYAGGAVALSDAASGYLGFSEQIPLLQMVCHGSFSYSGEALNLAADYEGSLLRAAEFGESLYFALTESPDGNLPTRYTDNFSSSLDYWAPMLKEAAAYLKPMQDATAGKRMCRHEKLADGVYRMTYEDGTCVTVNYTEQPYADDTAAVSPRDYAVTE